MEQSSDKGGQQQEQHQRQAQRQHHGKGHQHILQLFRRDVLFQPLIQLTGLSVLIVRKVICREHQRFDAGDDGAQKCGRTANDRPAQNRVFILDEFPLRHLRHQPLRGTDHDRVLFRSPHKDPLDQCLAADGGAECTFFFLCHGNFLSYRTSIAHFSKNATLVLLIFLFFI